MNKDFYHIHYSYFNPVHLKMYKSFGLSNDGAKFFHDVSLAFGFNAYVPRDGVWSTPWDGHLQVEPNNTMPDLDPGFSKSFGQILDESAQLIGYDIDRYNHKFIVPYSGGIDSTCIMVSLLKNLDKEQLKNICVSMSFDSIAENPYFYSEFIEDKFLLHDSHNYDLVPLCDKGWRIVIGDQGDALFGTELGTKFYASLHHYITDDKQCQTVRENIINPNFHYSSIKEHIIQHFNNCLKAKTTNPTPWFGEKYYNRLVHNIKTSKVEISSIHDFFWWIIFNIKYMHCAMRAGSIQSWGRDRSKVYETMVHFFGSQDFQKWSMVNNYNGQKIQNSFQGRYKIAAKDYIHKFDKNDWYYWYKIKIPSKPLVVNRKFNEREQHTFGIDTDYQMVYLTDPGVEDYFYESLKKFEV